MLDWSDKIILICVLIVCFLWCLSDGRLISLPGLGGSELK